MFEILGLITRDYNAKGISVAARSKDPLRRVAAAMHAAATRGTLELLANDQEPLVRDQAMLHLIELDS